jgi:hypothetical protein
MYWSSLKSEYLHLKNIAKNIYVYKCGKTLWQCLYSSNVDCFTLLARLKKEINKAKY